MFDSPDSLLGKHIDQFRLDQFIARGAMGMVFKAFDSVLLRTVAVKLISKSDVAGAPEEELATREEARKRLIQEAKAAGRLTHPNIVTIHCYGETDEFVYICMEFINGKTLTQLLNEHKTLSVDETLFIFDQILQALELSGQEEIVHRDIKPSNIMLTDDNRVKIMDFGIAKLPSLSMTTVGTVLGTPHYMSPEQISGQVVDIRSDLFSVGAVFYEALTGERPFAAENTAALIYKILEVDPIPPRVLNIHIPEPVGDILKKALTKDPAHRFQTPTEMLTALRVVSQSRMLPVGMPNDTTVVKKRLLSEHTVQVKSEDYVRVPVPPPVQPVVEVQSAPNPTAQTSEVVTAAKKPETKEQEAEPKKAQVKEKAARSQPSPKPVPGDKKTTGTSPGRAKILGGFAVLVLLAVGAVLLLRMFSNTARQAPVPASLTTGAPVVVGQTGITNDQLKSSVESLIGQAKSQWESDPAAAQKLLEQAVALDPNHFEATFQLARFLTFRKEFPAAIQQYQNALRIDNQASDVFFNLGYIYHNQGAFDQAIESYEACRALSPPYLDQVLTNLAIAYWKKNNPVEAKLLLKQALDLNPNNELAKNYFNTLEKSAGAKK